MTGSEKPDPVSLNDFLNARNAQDGEERLRWHNQIMNEIAARAGGGIVPPPASGEEELPPSVQSNQSGQGQDQVEEKHESPGVLPDLPAQRPADEEPLSDPAPGPADQVAINILPAGEVECAICYNPCLVSDPHVIHLECFHAFHRHCIARWMQQNRSCPVCRTPVAPRVLEEIQGRGEGDGDADDEDSSDSDDDGPAVGPPHLGDGGGPADEPPQEDGDAGGPLPGIVPIDILDYNQADAPINGQMAVGHHNTVPTMELVRVAVKAKWLKVKWIMLICVISLALCRGFNIHAVILAIILALFLRTSLRVGLSAWRSSRWQKLISISSAAEPVVLDTEGMNAIMREQVSDPVVEVNPGPSVVIAAEIDNFIQSASSSLGITNQLVTGRLWLRGRYNVPPTDHDFRPTNFQGTFASPQITEVCVSHLDNVHLQTTSLVVWSPEMVNQVLSSSRYIPAAQRALELGPRTSRITDQQLQSSFYSQVQAGSAIVAMLRASAHDLVDSNARAALLDFQPGSPSIPCSVLGIVPKMGAPFLLFLGMMLTSSLGWDFTTQLLAYPLKLAWGLL